MNVLKKTAVLCATLLSLSTASSHVFAQNGGSVGSGPNPYSDCGIGAAIFKNDAAASISNVIWDLGTTAVTSALSSPETCEGESVAAAKFIYETYAALEVQAAKGEGENLTAVFDILQCDNSDHKSLISSVREDFSLLVSDDHYADMTTLQRSEKFFNVVQDKTQGVCNFS